MTAAAGWHWRPLLGRQRANVATCSPSVRRMSTCAVHIGLCLRVLCLNGLRVYVSIMFWVRERELGARHLGLKPVAAT
ncbi:hypothetical protein LX36DRAFT_652728 [Colletotrichum falcatum]|nr:hypothetical protein LX36DRAFT_652728 [Colletotrichum falcatum]